MSKWTVVARGRLILLFVASHVSSAWRSDLARIAMLRSFFTIPFELKSLVSISFPLRYQTTCGGGTPRGKITYGNQTAWFLKKRIRSHQSIQSWNWNKINVIKLGKSISYFQHETFIFIWKTESVLWTCGKNLASVLSAQLYIPFPRSKKQRDTDDGTKWELGKFQTRKMLSLYNLILNFGFLVLVFCLQNYVLELQCFLGG